MTNILYQGQGRTLPINKIDYFTNLANAACKELEAHHGNPYWQARLLYAFDQLVSLCVVNSSMTDSAVSSQFSQDWWDAIDPIPY